MVREKEYRLRSIIRGYGTCVVAYSGGIDSSLVLRIAHDEMPGRVLAITGVSPSLSAAELEHAKSYASSLGIQHEIVATGEFSDENYLTNPVDRCYHCKSNLYRVFDAILARAVGCSILDGTNADDMLDFRPGTRAAREANVKSPLQEAGLTKADVREISRANDIPFWDKPASPCLSSRVPTGTRISPEILLQIDSAETALRSLGFGSVRVRFHGEIARIEVPETELPKILEPASRTKAAAAVRAAGFRYVTLDLEGYRPSGLAHIEGPNTISLI